MAAKGLALVDYTFCRYSFEECEPGQTISLAEFAEGDWQIDGSLSRDEVQVKVSDGVLTVSNLQENDSLVCLLRRC